MGGIENDYIYVGIVRKECDDKVKFYLLFGIEGRWGIFRLGV